VRILQLHTQYREPGGEDAVVRAEAELLRGLGHEVVQHQMHNPVGAMGAAGALLTSPWNPFAACSVQRVAEEIRPDVAHVHNTWYAMSPAVFRALRRAGVPSVMTLHNYRLLCANALLFRDGALCEDCVGSHPWHAVRHRCYRGCAVLSVPAAMTIALHHDLGTWTREVDLFLALNEFSRERFVRGGLPAERIRVKPNFVSDPGPRTLPASQSRTVLYVGRVSREKGVDVLINAWRLLGNTSLELAIVGDGPMQAELERRSRAAPGIRFEGRLCAEDVRRRMLAARALILPSVWYEGQPVVVLEGLAAGLPILSSAIGGMSELLQPLGKDWLVAPGATVTWAESLRVLTDHQRIEQGSKRARALYEQKFTDTLAASALEEAYARAVAHRARSAR
jgi:glycosyltransferase involved in cell wall biosynthesis